MLKSSRKNMPIKRVIIVGFIIALLISIGSIGCFVFRSWFFSAKQTTESLACKTNGYIYDQICTYLQLPLQINEANHKIIANGILNLSHEQQRDKFFIGVLSSYEEKIYSFSCGTETGEYYGARRNENGVIEIMRNNSTTGGNSWYYMVNDDLTAGEIAVKAGKFDPRTRDWYKIAVASDAPSFSPIYKHFIMDDLTISHSCPIYDEDGNFLCVLGTHMLLNDLGTYLKDTVDHYDGYAVIFEKDTNDLIANSMGLDNFTVNGDGNIERYDISSIQSPNFQSAYVNYRSNPQPNCFYDDEIPDFYINVKEINMTGLDWIIISAIPEDFLITPVLHSIRFAAALALLFILLSFIVYRVIIGKLLKPIDSLLQATDYFAGGDLSKRIDIVRDDEIGRISESFNKVAEEMQFLVNNLEVAVADRTDELHRTNAELEESKDQLRLILDSAAEAIYGIDVHGNCTFCNISCVKMLGYDDQEDLLGQNMHWKIHHTQRDGTTFPIDQCRIFKAFIDGKGSHVDDEVLWRADGTSFDAEYYSFPQIKNGNIVGAVVTFMDISDRKQKEAKIQYLSCYDTLTGLFNRRCFEEHRRKIDTLDNLPLSIIFADINGLKMTNDIFGHAAGDELIKKTSEILRQECRENDIIARVGGDEFIILLPNTTEENAEKIVTRIRNGFSDTYVKAVKCSISLGLDTKRSQDQPLEAIISNAESAMYKDKILNRKSVNKEIIDTIIGTLHTKRPRERQHSNNVRDLSVEIGKALDLSETKINKLSRAAYLHDIGKIVLDDNLLSIDTMDEDSIEIIRQHSVVGYRILNIFDDTLDLAEYVYSHHEKWDGTGYPRGLKGEQIPFLSRIISVAETYDRALYREELPLTQRKKIAEEIIRKGAGTRFDPHIVEVFLQLINS